MIVLQILDFILIGIVGILVCSSLIKITFWYPNPMILGSKGQFEKINYQFAQNDISEVNNVK